MSAPKIGLFLKIILTVRSIRSGDQDLGPAKPKYLHKKGKKKNEET
jgi:hypothetical protein